MNTQVTTPVYTYDQTYAAMCIWEEICMPTQHGEPWVALRDAISTAELRTVVIEKLADACDKAWTRATEAHNTAWNDWYERRGEAALQMEHTGAQAETMMDWITTNPPPLNPGDFDWEFVPTWLRIAVDWSDLDHGPRVLGSGA